MFLVLWYLSVALHRHCVLVLVVVNFVITGHEGLFIISAFGLNMSRKCACVMNSGNASEQIVQLHSLVLASNANIPRHRLPAASQVSDRTCVGEFITSCRTACPNATICSVCVFFLILARIHGSLSVFMCETMFVMFVMFRLCGVFLVVHAIGVFEHLCIFDGDL